MREGHPNDASVFEAACPARPTRRRAASCFTAISAACACALSRAVVAFSTAGDPHRRMPGQRVTRSGKLHLGGFTLRQAHGQRRSPPQAGALVQPLSAARGIRTSERCPPNCTTPSAPSRMCRLTVGSEQKTRPLPRRRSRTRQRAHGWSLRSCSKRDRPLRVLTVRRTSGALRRRCVGERVQLALNLRNSVAHGTRTSFGPADTVLLIHIACFLLRVERTSHESAARE